MKWKNLKKFIKTLNVKELNQKVIIFPFADGCFETLNGASKIGLDEMLDSHSSDSENHKEGTPYLLCGAGESSFKKLIK